MSGAAAPAVGGDCRLCTFVVDGLRFGVQVTAVQEVIRAQEMTDVPLASAVIAGLINLRGEIVTAIDLRRLLRLPPRPAAAAPLNVVLRSGAAAVSLLVDEIGEVVDVAASSFELPPETLGASAKELIQGVYKSENQLLLLLNTTLAMRASEVFGVGEGDIHVAA